MHIYTPGIRRSRGFTLIELVVVVGIIALLMAIVVPAILASQRKAAKTKAAAELIAIATAIDAYKADFGDIPRTPPNIGFAVLGKALFSPGPENAAATPAGGLQAPTAPFLAGAVGSTGSGVNYKEFVAYGEPDTSALGANVASGGVGGAGWAEYGYSDGKDGPGFRVRVGSKPYPGYLQPEKFKIRGLAVLDNWGNPILYFPARPGNVAKTPGWVLLANGGTPVFNAGDNITFFYRPSDTDNTKAMKRMSALVVKDTTDFDGTVPTGASAASTGPFLLWSAGPDGKYGVDYANANPTKDEIGKNDDIANFKTE